MINLSGFKVMHVRSTNFFGGPEKQVVEHVRLLRDTGVRPLVCSFREKGAETELVEKARALGVPSFSIPCRGAYDPGQVVRLRRLFKSEKPELVCTHDYRSTALTFLGRAGLPLRQVAFWRGITRENAKVAVYYKVESCLLRKVDHVVVVSKKQRDFLVSHGLLEDKVSLVPNAVEVVGEARTDLLARFGGKTIIATAGRLSPEKGHRYLIEAMPAVLTTIKDAVLLIFGDGPVRNDLARLVERVGCADSIYFLGFVPGFSSFLADVDLFALPSLTEGLPNALLEALAAAKPVVASAVGGVPEVVVDGKTGVLVSPGDTGQLAAAIVSLLSDAGLARTMGQAGQDAVRKSYSFERQLELLTKVYARTLAAEKT